MSWTASTFLKQHLDILTPNPKNAAVFRGWITSEVIRVIRLCSNSTWAVLLWKEDVRIQWSIRKRLWKMDINKPTKERASEKIKAADTSIREITVSHCLNLSACALLFRQLLYFSIAHLKSILHRVGGQ